MATTLINGVALGIGEETSATVTDTEEKVGLRLASVKSGTADAQVRLVCTDTSGRVKASLVIDDTGTEEIHVDRISGDLSCEVVCSTGSVTVTLTRLEGSEKLGEGTATAGIVDASVTTAKLAPGAATLAKVGISGMKSLVAAGRNGAGAVTLTGAAVGDRVLIVIGTVTAGTGPLLDSDGDFESAVTVVNQIQQSAAGNLSANTYQFVLIPATA